jgi:hypothetical protein
VPRIVQETYAFKTMLECDRPDPPRNGSKQVMRVAVGARIRLASRNDQSSAGAHASQAVERALVNEWREADLRAKPVDFSHPATVIIEIGQLARHQEMNIPGGRRRGEQDEIAQNGHILHKAKVKCDESPHGCKFAAASSSARGLSAQ